MAENNTQKQVTQLNLESVETNTKPSSHDLGHAAYLNHNVHNAINSDTNKDGQISLEESSQAFAKEIKSSGHPNPAQLADEYLDQYIKGIGSAVCQALDNPLTDQGLAAEAGNLTVEGLPGGTLADRCKGPLLS